MNQRNKMNRKFVMNNLKLGMNRRFEITRIPDFGSKELYKKALF